MKLFSSSFFFLTNRLYSGGSKFLRFTRFVAIGSVSLGVIALVLSFSILEGFDTTIRTTASEFTAHISLVTFSRQHFIISDSSLSLLKAHSKNIVSADLVIERECLIQGNSNHIEGGLLRSVSKDTFSLQSPNFVFEGKKIFSSAIEKKKEIILSMRMANRLDKSIGDSVLLTLINNTDSNQSTTFEYYTVIGMYATGMAQYDNIVTFIQLHNAKKLCSLPENGYTTIDIMVSNIDSAQSTSQSIEEFLGYPFYSRTVFELHSSIFTWIELQKEPIPVVLSLISAVALLNIITTLLISVVEKTHSIGVLRSIGLRTSTLLLASMYQGLRLGFLGAFLGFLLSGIFYYLQINFKIITLNPEIYFIDHLPISFVPDKMFIVLGTTILISLLASIVPAIVVSRISIVKALRFS